MLDKAFLTQREDAERRRVFVGELVVMKIYNRQFGLAQKSLEFSQIKLSMFSMFTIVLQLFVRLFASGDEIQVWTKKDRYGRISWHAYDSASGTRVSWDTEVEMREWIEQRYYKS